MLDTLIEFFKDFGRLVLTIQIFSMLMFFLYVCTFFLKRIHLKRHYTLTELSSITEGIFLWYCKFPEDKELFQKLPETFLNDSFLPIIDMNFYNFKNINITNCFFHKKTKLPLDKNFFQKISNKDISYCSLPNGDYSNFNFKGVNISQTKFKKDSYMPQSPDFFTSCAHPEYIAITLPKSFDTIAHLYDYYNVRLYPSNKLKLTEYQKNLMCLKGMTPFLKL